ncbi:4-hydroxy-tetrahydrodipicolinate reductase [Hydrogenivirga sp. 128-5-R1-1]|uniref:4-hydroxy-tetrahydrodipicolinate reductase n=1 Tax=Hydrogenivirga sp. 128-5-R1-1 TaxID=392423 RepID=UPI00015F1752|nr:4-hydroxy-tetrahydrodipicolinate reductase [Hydrogenivirga sp. 128-5-R1-1]EDP76064.1 dihydrodipicolinate reductase [Hydrogenivirga sp. 128-5-R1-1]
MSTRVVVCGALGRMGRRIIELSLQDPEVEVVGGVEHPDCIPSLDLGEALSKEELRGVLLTSRLEELLPSCNVVIEFSGNTTAAVGHTKLATLDGKAVVIGTTGFTEGEVKDIEECSKNAPVLLSPNMSLGVNLLFKLVETAARVLKDKNFDMEVVEVHHRFKKDAPSGTAVKLTEILKETADLKKVVHGREGEAPREQGELGVFAVRGGDVVGDHTVYFLGFGERIELTHRATSRDTFAKGSVEAAKWIKGKEPGMYTMFDVLNL